MRPKQHRWQDHYTRQAKKERYPARSVFKLREIQQKFRLIKPGDAVLDLGCSPGSWLLYAAQVTGKAGRVVGIDISPVSLALPPHVTVITGDVLSMGAGLPEAVGTGFNAVLSDMAPSTTGRKDVDAARSFDLCSAALSIADRCLVTGGSFLCKIFHGEDFKLFSAMVNERFNIQKTLKPQSSRKASREIFIIGIGKKD